MCIINNKYKLTIPYDLFHMRQITLHVSEAKGQGSRKIKVKSKAEIQKCLRPELITIAVSQTAREATNAATLPTR